jgi:hypothetical protein
VYPVFSFGFAIGNAATQFFIINLYLNQPNNGQEQNNSYRTA